MKYQHRFLTGASVALTLALAACGGAAAPASAPSAAAKPASPSASAATASAPASSRPSAAAASASASGAPAASASPRASASASAAGKPQASAAPLATATEPPGSPGATPAAERGKPQLQEDAQHTGRSPYAGPRDLRLARSYQSSPPANPATSGRPDIQSDPVVGPDGTIYLDNFPGLMMALADGPDAKLDLKWQFHEAGASGYHSTPAVESDGTALLGISGRTDPHTTIDAFKAPPSGDQPRIAWHYDLGPGRMTSALTIGADGTIYAVSGQGKLAALTPDGKEKWTAQAGPSEHAAPALAGNGVVYLPSTDGNLYAVAPPPSGASQGGVVWRLAFGTRTGIPTRSAPGGGFNGQGSSTSATVGPDGTVYVGANNSDFYAVNPDGTLKWKFEAEPELAGIWSSAALSADAKVIYFGANKGGLYALDTATGSKVWQNPLFGGSIYDSPALDKNGTLYVGTTTGHVFALDASSGKQLSVYDSGGAVWSTPSIRPDGSLVAANRDGLIFELT